MINLLGVRSWLRQSADGLPAHTPETDAVFQAIVDTHYRRVYAQTYRIVRNEADAADLTQEVFVRVHNALPRLRADGAQSAWVRRIATNVCLDFLRRRKAAPAMTSLDAPLSSDPEAPACSEVPDSSTDPAHCFANDERSAVLYRAICSLPEEYRSVVLLHHLEDMRVEEIADVLGVPAGTVKSRLSRARKMLRRKLLAYFEPELAERPERVSPLARAAAPR